jgi:hypothetical protein
MAGCALGVDTSITAAVSQRNRVGEWLALAASTTDTLLMIEPLRRHVPQHDALEGSKPRA